MPSLKIAIAAPLALASASTAAFAQPTGFTGFYGQAGLGLGNSNTKSTFTEVEAGNVDSETQKYGTSNIAGNLALGYNHGFSNGFNLGANIFYNIRSNDSGSTSESEPEESMTTSSLLKNIWGISIEPGYAFADNSLGYLKLGWAQASSSLQLDEVKASPGATTTTVNFGTTNGFLYGLGYKHLVNKNVYVGVEFYQILFGSKSKSQMGADAQAGDPLGQYQSSPTYTYAGLVLGVKF